MFSYQIFNVVRFRITVVHKKVNIHSLKILKSDYDEPTRRKSCKITWFIEGEFRFGLRLVDGFDDDLMQRGTNKMIQ